MVFLASIATGWALANILHAWLWGRRLLRALAYVVRHPGSDPADLPVEVNHLTAQKLRERGWIVDDGRPWCCVATVAGAARVNL